MLNLILLGGKILFLVVLYLFIYWVVRSALRESRSAAAAPRAAARVGHRGAPSPCTPRPGARATGRRPRSGVPKRRRRAAVVTRGGP